MSPLNFLSKLDLDTTEVDFEKEEKQPIKKEPEKLLLNDLKIGAGEMAQWLRAPTALPKVPSSNPSNHMVAHNHP